MTISRTSLARFLTSQPAAKRPAAVQQAAAWLISTGQSRRVGELAMEVARLQAEEGRLWARVTTARSLEPAVRRQVEDYLIRRTGCRDLELELAVDPALIGGLRIETADQALDATVQTKLRRLIQETAA